MSSPCKKNATKLLSCLVYRHSDGKKYGSQFHVIERHQTQKKLCLLIFNSRCFYFFGAACGFTGFLFSHSFAQPFARLNLAVISRCTPKATMNLHGLEISSTKLPIFALASPSINMNFLVMALWAAFDNIRQHKLWLFQYKHIFLSSPGNRKQKLINLV